jgi:vacuolar-type H+-ATPase subunit I/STV1
VNTYGVPRYREANPALFTAATFPFFFGVIIQGYLIVMLMTFDMGMFSYHLILI